MGSGDEAQDVLVRIRAMGSWENEMALTVADSVAAMLHPLFAPEAVIVRGRGSLPDEELRRADVVIVLDPLGRRPPGRSLGFSYHRRFAALPDAEQPRWLIPLDAGPIAAGAFAFHAPYRRAGRAKYALARLAARLGAPVWYRHVLWLSARSTPPLESWMGQTIGRPVRLGLARGAAGARPKPIAVALDAAGKAVAFAKLAREPERRDPLRREAHALKTLAERPETADLGPRLLGETEVVGTYVTLQEPLRGLRGPATLASAHDRFLRALGAGDHRRPVSTSAFVRNLGERATGADASMLRRLIALVEEVELPRVMVHGDFAPWNLRAEGSRLRAFDWEWWCEDGLPLVDALHHRLQSGFLLAGWSAVQAAGRLESEARSRPFGLTPQQTRAIQAISILDYVLHIAEDGYSPEPLAVRYRELLARILTAVGG
ncbi:MAG: hypothetical protein M3O91_08090 [Chloroflexota bacterium]|nr:hypothetical protein [Chloroflexota bacterium]